ncbi:MULTISPECIES: sensor histidine kinase [unclassified Pseudoalteromonas]|uniref:sensor histidine kinase n=1 Tax=unclassified Pseudoalteromonas TaxID=194690 RepID=UPI00390C5EC5|nr:histidine kinase [Ningiella sp. W23]
MTEIKRLVSIESFTAIIAWAAVSGSALWLMVKSDDYSVPDLIIVTLCFLAFISCFMIANANYKTRLNERLKQGLLTIQYAVLLVVAAVVPYTYIAILSTIWCAQLPYFMRLRHAICLSLLCLVPLFLIFTFYWGKDDSLLTGLLFWTFNLFALVVMNTTRNESLAREKSEALNRELIATQTLLSEATKQAERTRIARNIHDLLGHHLTALTINLQVAQRTSEGAVHENIKQCHSLAKLLLSDVREAVSEIRDRSAIEIKQALQALINNVPQLKIKLNIVDEAMINDVRVADALLRCTQESITNTLKHSYATELTIAITHAEHVIHLTIVDNAHSKTIKPLQKGHGLKGIEERVNDLGGCVKFKHTTTGFVTQITLVEPQ